jgi:hypothetical protein
MLERFERHLREKNLHRSTLTRDDLWVELFIFKKSVTHH